MSIEVIAFNWRSIIGPMRYSNVPSVDARYWTAITLASIFGCNLGDCLSFYAHWNHWMGLAPLTVVFAALLFVERRSARATEAWYWAIVIVLRAAATNLADLATHTFEWPYPSVIVGLVVLQALVIWPVLPRLLLGGKKETGRPATNGWYWLSLLTAGTLGTAIGDCAAEELHLGTGYGTLVLGAIFAVVLAIGSRSRWITKAAYWVPIIAVRAAGTCAGDWLAFRERPGIEQRSSSRTSFQHRIKLRPVCCDALRMESFYDREGARDAIVQLSTQQIYRVDNYAVIRRKDL